MHIIDNFFKDPHGVRRLALSLKDKYLPPNSDESWPGLRCDVPEPLRFQCESKIKKITQDDDSSIYLESFTKIFGLNPPLTKIENARKNRPRLKVL